METGDIIQLAILAISILAVIVAIVNSYKTFKKSIDLAHKQFKVQVFLEYTRRYKEIMLHMPGSSLFEKSAEDPNIIKYMRSYFDLCSEEYHLWTKKMIDQDVWDIWLEGMRNTMHYKVCQTLWNNLCEEYYSEFWRFFQRVVINRENITTQNDADKSVKKDRKCSLRALINKIKNIINLK